MIQVNLLPDVKTKYIKTQRKKRLVILCSIVISSIAIGILVIELSIAYGAQKWQLAHYDNLNKQNIATLNKVQDLNKMLTVQNQINKLNELHAEKPNVARIFTFLPQITPNDVKIDKLKLDLTSSTMSVSGSANSSELVNKFVDTLKFTKLKIDGQDTGMAFSTVVLSGYSADKKDVRYTVDFKYQTPLFVRDKKVELEVPKVVTTRSTTEQPNPLFSQQSGGQ